MASEFADEVERGIGKLAKLGVLLLLGFIALMLWVFCTVSVPSGNVGILTTFGAVEPIQLSEGLHFKLPWQEVTPMSIKTMELLEIADTPTDEGLTVTLDTSILYHIQKDKAASIFQNIGPDYEVVVIEPNLRSTVRGVTASYDAKSLYTSERETISGKIFDELEPKLRDRGIVLERVLLRSVKMPDAVRDGIEAKLVADQDAQRMEFILLKEKQEAERKRIEAGGIADSQKIIDNSLTQQYLTWYWITNLDKYNNVIYVPIGDNGMPLFKDVDSVGRPQKLNSSQ